MKQTRRWRIGCAAWGVVLAIAQPAGAGSPWWRAPNPYGKIAYAPYTPNYVVVSPVPMPAAKGHGAHAAPSCSWQAQRVPAPAYPWGWFGGHTSPQPWTHTRFYGDQRDHAVLRED